MVEGPCLAATSPDVRRSGCRGRHRRSEGVRKPVEQLREAEAIGVTPVADGVGQPGMATAPDPLQEVAPARGELELSGPGVAGVGVAADEPALREAGDLPADGRHVEAEIGGDVGEADRRPVGDPSQQDEGRPFDVRARTRRDRGLGARHHPVTDEADQCVVDRLDGAVDRHADSLA